LFMNVEVDSEQLSNLPNITQQIHGRRWVKIEFLRSQHKVGRIIKAWGHQSTKFKRWTVNLGLFRLARFWI
jgi:hypothetical protein